MFERDDDKDVEVEVRPETAANEESGEAKTPRPGLFSELGTGITTGEVVVKMPSEEDDEAAPAAEEESARAEAEGPGTKLLTGRRKGGAYKRAVEEEPQPRIEGV